jgi:hypothetical protein
MRFSPKPKSGNAAKKAKLMHFFGPAKKEAKCLFYGPTLLIS